MKNPTFLVAIFSCFFTGCYYGGSYTPPGIYTERQAQNPYYVLPTNNVALLQDKGDLSFAGCVDLSDERTGVDLSVAHKPLSHWGYMLSYSNQFGNVSQDSYYKGNWSYNKTELSVGYSLNFEKIWMAECFAGGGFGSTRNDHGSGRSLLKQQYFFLQPAISIHTKNQKQEVAIVMRLNNMHVKINQASFDSQLESYTADQFDLISKHPSQWMIEPGIVYRFGWPSFKFQFAANISGNLTTGKLQGRESTFSMGLVYKLNTLLKN